LVNAIIEKFGPNERFHTCSVDGFTAKEMVDFLEARGKFKPSPTGGLTVDMTQMCHH